MDFPYLFNDHLQAGLPREGRVPVNAVFMEYMHNAKSMGVGSVFPEKITAPSSETLAHPFPQFVRGERGDFIFKQDGIKYRAGRSGSFSNLSVFRSDSPVTALTVNASASWQFVSFEKLWFASNSNQFIFKIPTYPSFVTGVSTLHVGALGKHGRRLLLGDVSTVSGTNWFTSSRWQHVMKMWRNFQPKAALGHELMTWDPSWTVYLEPGGGADDIPYHIGLAMLGVFGDAQFDDWLSFIDTYLESGEIGLIPSRVNSAVLAIKELGGGSDTAPPRLISYGRDGVVELKPNGYRYEEEVISEVGIASRNSVGGGLDGHVAVDSQYHLLVVPAGGEATTINHSTALTPGEGAGEYIVSYDELFGDYWITEGTKAWVYNGAFSGPIDICPTGLVRDSSAGLLGYGLDQAEASYPWEIRFVPVNMGVIDFKKITTMMFEAVGLTDIEMRVDARFAGDGAWFNGPWLPAFRNNFSTASKAGVELRVSFRGTTTLADPARLSSLEVRYVGKAGNVRRGPAPRSS